MLSFRKSKPKRQPHKDLPIGVVIILFLAGITLIGTILGFGLIILPWLIGSGDSEVVNHSVPSPDNSVIAVVIRDDCGATCSCQMRVDLKMQEQYIREVYRSFEACDATVTWMSANELEIVDSMGEREVINVDEIRPTP